MVGLMFFGIRNRAGWDACKKTRISEIHIYCSTEEKAVKRRPVFFNKPEVLTQQSKALYRHAAKSITSTVRFLLFDIIIR